MTTAVDEVSVVTASDLLQKWQGHRRLTRRVIEAFPEGQAVRVFSGRHAALRGPGMGVHPYGCAHCRGRRHGQMEGV